MNKKLKRVFVFEGMGAVVLYHVLQTLREYARRPVRIIVEPIDQVGEGLLEKGIEIRGK